MVKGEKGEEEDEERDRKRSKNKKWVRDWLPFGQPLYRGRERKCTIYLCGPKLKAPNKRVPQVWVKIAQCFKYVDTLYLGT